MTADSIYQLLPLSFRDGFRDTFDYAQKRRMKKLNAQFFNEGDLVFDIGANMGNYAKVYNDLGARIVCLEPQPYCIDKLEEKFSQKSNITIVRKGVSDSEGELELNIDSKNHATATFSQKFKEDGPFNNRIWNGKVKVPVTTLDILIEEFGKPTYCKIDVEGFEYQVVKGLSQPINYISFEYTQSLPEIADDVMKHLQTLGAPTFNLAFCNRPTKLVLDEWTADRQLVLNTLKDSSLGYSGDIYVHFSSEE